MTELLEPDTAQNTPTFQTQSVTSETLKAGKMENSKPDETLVLQEKKMDYNSRVEIDTSHPFESVKEAVTRFGGSAVWRSPNKNFNVERIPEEVDIAKVEEQTSLLEKDLIMKERETLEVLKELEATKKLVEELKLKLQNEASESIATPELTSQTSEHLVEAHQNTDGDLNLIPDSAPGLILLELKQAKMNLGRTTNDLADIRASVETLSKKLEKERASLKKTRERLTSNSSKISSLEEELNRTRHRLQLAKDAEIMGNSGNPMEVSKELQKLTSEAEQFKKMAETAKSEVLRATTEIEQTKTSIRTAEIRWVTAKKMSEAARATEAAALAEIKALSNSETSIKGPEGITLSFEEYSSLTRKAREADEISKKRVLDAVVEVDEANISKMRILRKVEEAAEEVKTSKKALEEAQNRVEVANREKLAVEEALRKWRSEHGQKRRSVYNSSKFKNSCPSHYRKDSKLIKINGLNLNLNLPEEGSKPVLKPTLSIGQILSRKLLMPDEVDMGMQAEDSPGKPKVSLGQILGKQCGVVSPPPLKPDIEENAQKQFSAKRKKFGFTRFSLLLAKQSKKKKKQAVPATSYLMGNTGGQDVDIKDDM